MRFPGFDYLKKKAGSPVYGAFIALLTLLAGFTASFFSDSLRTSFPFTGSFTPLGSAFWCLVGVWLLLFLARQVAESESVKTLQNQSARIMEAVLTLPPRDFVRELCRATTTIHTLLMDPLPRQSKGEITKDELERMIRFLLSTVAALASMYDGRSARYMLPM